MITKIDLANYRQLRAVIDSEDVELRTKGNSHIRVSLLLKWFFDLEPVLAKLCQQEETKASMAKAKKLKNPIKKVK